MISRQKDIEVLQQSAASSRDKEPVIIQLPHDIRLKNARHEPVGRNTKEGDPAKQNKLVTDMGCLPTKG